LVDQVAALRKQVEDLLQRNATLTARLDQAQRRAARQAAPFSNLKTAARPTPTDPAAKPDKDDSPSGPVPSPTPPVKPRWRSISPSPSVPAVVGPWRKSALSRPRPSRSRPSRDQGSGSFASMCIGAILVAGRFEPGIPSWPPISLERRRIGWARG
jgi:hypothetical protein